MTEPTIAAAAGTATGSLHPDGRVRANLIEAAMHQATEDAMRDGISDPDEILSLKLAARERVKAELNPEN